MNSDEYLEVARFKTRDGVTDEAFLAAERGVREGLLKTFPGFIARELHQLGPGDWLVLLRFASQATMNALLQRLKVAPDTSFSTLGSLIDHSTMRVEFASRRL